MLCKIKHSVCEVHSPYFSKNQVTTCVKADDNGYDFDHKAGGIGTHF